MVFWFCCCLWYYWASYDAAEKALLKEACPGGSCCDFCLFLSFITESFLFVVIILFCFVLLLCCSRLLLCYFCM